MARLYSRKKGKSGSIKPVLKKEPSWVRYKEKEIEMLIVKLGKEGKTSSEIGIILRDIYGIPNVKLSCHKPITQILDEHKLTPKIPSDLMSLIKKAIAIKKHFEENRHDMTAKRGTQLTESKIKRLTKYYKRTNRLPSDWKYDPSRASLLID